MTEIFFNDFGAQVELVSAGAEGGEGRIYRLQGSDSECAKVYSSAKVSAELRAKVQAMLKNPPEDINWQLLGQRSISWPSRMLFYDASRQNFAGFTMPLIDLKNYQTSDKYYGYEDRRRRYLGFSWEYLLTAACNLASAIAALHKVGHCVGDLQDQNVLVSDRALVALVDCDSFQVKDRESGRIFYTRVGIGEYRAPEVMLKDFVKEDIDRYYTDLFALAVLVFKLLMSGVHPFAGVGQALEDSPQREDKICKGLFPYEPAMQKQGVAPPPYAPPFQVIPPSLQDLFRQCFVHGQKQPQNRPSAEQWYRALKQAKGQLQKCRTNPHHIYAGHLKNCPWCRVYKKTGKDFFPPAGRQTPLKKLKQAPKPGPSAAQPAISTPALSPQTYQPGQMTGQRISPRRVFPQLLAHLKNPLLLFRVQLFSVMFLAGALLGYLMSFLDFAVRTVAFKNLYLNGGQVVSIFSALAALAAIPDLAYWRKSRATKASLSLSCAIALALVLALNYFVGAYSYHYLAAFSWALIAGSLAKASEKKWAVAAAGQIRFPFAVKFGLPALAAAVLIIANLFARSIHEPATIAVAVKGTKAQVRSEPGFDHNVIRMLENGRELYRLAGKDQWNLVMDKNKPQEPHSLPGMLKFALCAAVQFRNPACGDGWMHDSVVRPVNAH